MTAGAVAMLAALAVAAGADDDGLALHLDANDAATVTRDAAGRVSAWAGRAGKLVARQDDPAARPRYVPGAIGGRPAIRFDGGDVLTLGEPPALSLGPKDAFTVVVVCRTTGAARGTLVARGGGPIGKRPWQLYVASGRIGAIVGGGRHEAPAGPPVALASLVADGRTVQVYADGHRRLRFAVGPGGGTGDVLLGARRRGADNTGTHYALTGDLAEVLVYRRALGDERRRRIEADLRRKYGLRQAPAPAARPARAAEIDISADATKLASADPFERGMAWWAIAEKVGADNNAQSARWPGKDPPAWFRTWSALPPERVLEADYVRQAVALGIDRDAKKLLAGAADAIRRAERVAGGPVPGLRAMRKGLSEATAAGLGDLRAAQGLWLAARLSARPVVLARRELSFDRLLFVKRFGPHTRRNITRPFAWKHKPGGGLCVLEGVRRGGEVRELIGGRLGAGHVRGVDLRWDAGRVVFGYAAQPRWPPGVDSRLAANTMALRKTQPPMHLFEIDLASGALRQLTDSRHWSDFEPACCADGRVVFASDRCARAPQCGSFGNDMTTTNLFVLDPRTRRVRHLTDNKDYDRYPAALSDGRIVYTHWEYQERHYMEVHSIWTVRPDGRGADTLFKHHMPAPLALRQARSVPGSAKLVAVATGHHTFCYGPVVRVDPARGMNAAAGIEVVTPGARPQEGRMAGRTVRGGGVRDAGGFYTTPWALSETCFLTAYAYARPRCSASGGADSNGFGIYLIDVFGNKELIYRDALFCCIRPIPLRPRRRPPVVADLAEGGPAEPDHAWATCYVPDVHEGLDGVARGAVRFLRVCQHVAWPFDPVKGKMPYLPGGAFARQFGFWSWSPVRVIGTVPVEPDGSAHFRVPADTAVYFQALDEQRMEIRRMRSMVSLKAGETRGCNGCHETRAAAPASRGAPYLALRGEPRTPTPPPWGAERLLAYEDVVQPVLDRRCVRCHSGPKAKGGLDFSAERAPDGLVRSFRTMFGESSGGRGRVLVSVADRFSDGRVTRPGQFGSRRSRLTQVLLTDAKHRENVTLRPAEWEALVTWVDTNAPYYGAFIDKRPASGKPVRRFVPELRSIAASKEKAE